MLIENKFLVLDLVLAILLSGASVTMIITGNIPMSMLFIGILAYSDLIISHYRYKYDNPRQAD
jgi:hypothetical protein